MSVRKEPGANTGIVWTQFSGCYLIIRNWTSSQDSFFKPLQLCVEFYASWFLVWASKMMANHPHYMYAMYDELSPAKFQYCTTLMVCRTYLLLFALPFSETYSSQECCRITGHRQSLTSDDRLPTCSCSIPTFSQSLAHPNLQPFHTFG